MNKRPALPIYLFRALCGALPGASLIMATASAANLIKNGDFANVGGVYVNNTGNGGDDIQTAGATNIPDWTNVAHFVNETWNEASNSYSLTASPGNGSGYFVDLTGQSNSKPYGGIEQKVATVPGMGYELTFALGASTLYNGSGIGAAALTASAKGSSLLASHLFSLTPTSINEWKTESLTFIADSDSTIIEFLGDSNNSSEYVGLDNVVMETHLLGTATSLTASPTTATSGSPVSLTALVRPSEGSVTPTGKLEFKSGSTVLGTSTVNGAGQATYTTTALAVGKDSVTAVYSGDAIHAAWTSSSVVVTISASGATITVSPTSLAFGDQPAETKSDSKTVTIKNSGSVTVSLTSIKLAGSQADDFSLSKTCGSSLAAKASCTVSVIFKPVAVGSKTASISIADNASGSPKTVALSGTATSPSSAASISLSATSLSFGDEAPGKSSNAKSVTVKNDGAVTVDFKSISVTGGQADDFSLSKTCGSSLAAKASCTISVIFKPVAAGSKTASISIADNASGSPKTVALSGTGT